MASSTILRFSISKMISTKAMSLKPHHNRALIAAVIQPAHHINFARDAGHAKWQNRAPQKAINIAKKSGASGKLISRAKTIYAETKQADPKKCPKLAKVLQDANKEAVGKTVANFIAKLANRGAAVSTEVVLRGPSNSCIIVTGSVDKPGEFKQALNRLQKKTIPGFKAADGGTAGSFDRRGLIVSDPAAEGQEVIDLDRAEELAIECEAEEVEADEETEGAFKFWTSPEDLYTVKRALETQGIAIDTCEHTYVPSFMAPVDKGVLEQVEKFVERVQDEVDDIDDIFMNIERSG